MSQKVTVTLVLDLDEGSKVAPLENLRKFFGGNDAELVGNTYYVPTESGLEDDDAAYTVVRADVTALTDVQTG